MAVLQGVAALHGNERHPVDFVHLAGSVTETITGVKTFSGVAKFASGSATAPGIAFSAEATLGAYRVGAGVLGLAVTTRTDIVDGSNGAYAQIGRDSSTGGYAGLGSAGTIDVVLAREAANALAQRNATNGQTFRLYNTWTDASNYERAAVKWNTNVLEIGTEAAGTGTARDLALITGGTQRWTVGPATATSPPRRGPSRSGGGRRAASRR